MLGCLLSASVLDGWGYPRISVLGVKITNFLSLGRRSCALRDAIRIFGFAITCALGLLTASPVAAQTGRPVVLTDVHVSEEHPGATRVLLVFNHAIPQYTIVANDGVITQIAFGTTVRGPSASTP